MAERWWTAGILNFITNKIRKSIERNGFVYPSERDLGLASPGGVEIDKLLLNHRH